MGCTTRGVRRKRAGFLLFLVMMSVILCVIPVMGDDGESIADGMEADAQSGDMSHDSGMSGEDAGDDEGDPSADDESDDDAEGEDESGDDDAADEDDEGEGEDGAADDDAADEDDEAEGEDGAADDDAADEDDEAEGEDESADDDAEDKEADEDKDKKPKDDPRQDHAPKGRGHGLIDKNQIKHSVSLEEEAVEDEPTDEEIPIDEETLSEESGTTEEDETSKGDADQVKDNPGRMSSHEGNDNDDPSSPGSQDSEGILTEIGDLQGHAFKVTTTEWFPEWDEMMPGYGFARITPDYLHNLGLIETEYPDASPVPEFPTAWISLLLTAGIGGVVLMLRRK